LRREREGVGNLIESSGVAERKRIAEDERE
jgi:hypothetical protein